MSCSLIEAIGWGNAEAAVPVGRWRVMPGQCRAGGFQHNNNGAVMSVKLIDNEAFYGFRVRRTVNGRLYQEYFSLKKGGKRLGPRQTRGVERLGEARDEELRIEQQKSRQRRKAELCFHGDGSVKGISYLVKTEKSGTRTPIFQIGIASELEGKIICTSFSINAHGADAAWAKAVATYTRHKKISRGSKLYKKISGAMPPVDAAVTVGRGAVVNKGAQAAKPPSTKKVAKKAPARRVKKTAVKKKATKKKR
jgi:hypothetical protein